MKRQIDRVRLFDQIQTFRLSLQSKMILLICTLIIIIMTLLGVYYNLKYSETIEEQIGIRALNLAQAIAEIPEIIEAFNGHNPSETIQPIVERIRITTESEFIVVGNAEGIRYSHPLSERLGQRMVGDDNERALLNGESYVSKAVGSLGPSIRGKVPVYSEQGEIIGIVSVGFLIHDIEMTVDGYLSGIWFWLFFCIFIGIIGAVLISLHVKKSILGLEPREIKQLFQEREAILQSIHEAIIAVDKDGYVTLVNHAAKNILTTDSNEHVIGKHIKEILPQTKLTDVLETGESQYNQDLWVGTERFIVNRVPVYFDNRLMGAVSTFRNKTEIQRMAEELSKVKQYSEALRVQTHEFANKLNTISGLLQLNQIEEAIEFITKESKKQQEWIQFLIHNVTDSYISAVLLGKLNRAHELGIRMSIDDGSQMKSLLTEKQREGLVTVLGNLLENAYDAVLEKKLERRINIFFTDIGHEILFEIEDSGHGIEEEHSEIIFTKGFTTKEGVHGGIGLALVQQILEELGGHLSLEASELGGACFIIAIPKSLE